MIGSGRVRALLLGGFIIAALPAPPALAGGVSEYPWRDWENGWSIKPILGWESRPPSLPGSSKDARVAAGWYPKGTESDSWCNVLVLGRYFGDAVKEAEANGDPAAGPDPGGSGPASPESAKPPAAPAPERFPKWIDDWGKELVRRPERCKFTGKGKPCRLGPDPAWQYEGEYSVTTRERSPYGDREWYDSTNTWRIFAVGGRRGEYEVGALFFLKDETYGKGMNLDPVRESALSLRFLDAKDMVRKRDELDAKAKKSGGGDEAWFVRVRARIPEGWRYFRRGDTVYVHPDAIPGTNVEAMAARLDAMRKKAYQKLFPAVIDPDAPPAVVKVTRDERQYLAYGAPGGSLGYFAARQHELVLFYKAADWWDTIDSTAVLFHEGFHQYMNQALDGLSAHPWFEEGFGDYFGGWRLFEGDPRPGELAARRFRMGEILDKDAWIPTGDLLRMEWDAFYGKGPDAADPGITYAQSWSLVTFLRTKKYSACVDRYYAVLLDGVKKWKAGEATKAIEEGRPVRAAGDMPDREARALRAAALDQGFRGVDFMTLEKDWLAFATR